MSSARATLRTALSLISDRRKRHIMMVGGLMVITSILEAFSVASVVPLMNIFTGSKGSAFALLNSILTYFQLELGLSEIVAAAVLFIGSNCVSTSFIVVTDYVFGVVSSKVGKDTSTRMLKVMKRQTYPHKLTMDIAMNQSLLTYDLTKLVGVIRLLLQFISTSAVAIAVLITVGIVSPWATISLLLGTGTIYYIVSLISKKQVTRWGKLSAELQKEQICAIKELSINYTQYMLQAYITRASNEIVSREYKIRRAVVMSIFFGTFPRQVVYTFSLALIAIIGCVVYEIDGTRGVTSIGVLAVATQRLIPAIQNQYQNWVGIINANYSVERLANWLNNNMEDVRYDKNADIERNRILFEKGPHIEIQSLKIKKGSVELIYPNLTIKSTEKVALMGESGSGKSSLISAVSTLSNNWHGTIKYNGIDLREKGIGELNNIRKQLGYFTNKQCLISGSILKNIVLDEERVDERRLANALHAANLDEVIDKRGKHLNDYIDEGKHGLSEGQRQRLLLARVLYRDNSLLLLDEPTSALDSEMSLEVLKRVLAIYEQCTVIAVLHDERLVVEFDKLIRL